MLCHSDRGDKHTWIPEDWVVPPTNEVTHSLKFLMQPDLDKVYFFRPLRQLPGHPPDGPRLLLSCSVPHQHSTAVIPQPLPSALRLGHRVLSPTLKRFILRKTFLILCLHVYHMCTLPGMNQKGVLDLWSWSCRHCESPVGSGNSSSLEEQYTHS